MKPKRILTLIIAMAIMLSLLPSGAIVYADGAVTYLDAAWNDQTKQVDVTKKSVTNYTVVESGTTAWENGWYVVTNNVNIGSRIGITGTVHLILCDGVTLTASKGINLISDNTLYIYAQSEAADVMGKLNSPSNTWNYAGIGAAKDNNAGALIINGGAVSASGGTEGGAGIGGAQYGAGGDITINGGIITATGGTKGAGIGGGYDRSCGNVTINGGIITANGGQYGAGIGTGWGSGGNVTINGGTITANGGSSSAGIGGGYYSSCGNVTINGGIITAKGGTTYGGAGIGSGAHAGGGNVTITGGIVTAIGNNGQYNNRTQAGAGIGGSSYSDGGTIVISGGTVTAIGGTEGGAGIGGGREKSGGNVTITGGNVKAVAGKNAEAIGKGWKSTWGSTSSGTLKDADGNNISLKTITLLGMTEQKEIKNITGVDYGMNDVKILDTNTLYFYLPSSDNVTSVNIDNGQSFEPKSAGDTLFYCTHSKTNRDYCTYCGSYSTKTEPSTNADNAYLISKLSEFVWFADYVNAGNTDANAVLTNDIDISPAPIYMMGTAQNPYTGTFDGSNHKLTVNFSFGTVQYMAPFSYLNNATIKNLTVDGTIAASVKFAAGIAGYTSGDTKLENCMSLVTINSSVSGDATHGGLVANAATGSLTIDNCAFVGAINGENTQNCGGLVGWATVTAKIDNSYVAADFSINTSGSSNTIARNPGKVTVSNCYYVTELGSTPSNATYVTNEQVESGELAFLLNGISGGDRWYQNIDNGNVDKYPVPNSAHGTLYYGYTDCDAEEPTITNTKINTKKYIKGHNGGTPTCISAGYCVDCGEKYLEKDPSTHATNEIYYKYVNTEKHSVYHSCCNELIREENHNETAATCTGVKHCDTCNSSYGDIDSTNHTGVQKWVDTGYGEHEYKYTCCGAVTKTEAHSLKYSVNDDTDTIGVKCSVCADESTETWKSGHGTVTLKVSDKVYDGKAVEASYRATGFMNNWRKPADISFDYCCEDGCKTAGTHTVTMHVGDKEVTKEFTITKKTLTVNKVRAFSKAYDMTNKVFVNSIDFDGTVIYQKGDYAVFDIKDNVAIDLSKAVVTTESGDTDYYTEANVSNITLIGSDKDNYSIESSAEEVPLINTYGGDYQIYQIQVWITPLDQTLYGDDAVLDQTAYTVEGLDDIYTLSGEFLYEDTNFGKIRVNAENIKITYGDKDVKKYFDITDYYTGNVVHYCANHTFNDDGFCATGDCDSYETATLITKENCEDYGFKESEISEYEPKYAIYNGGQLYWFADRVNNYNETGIVGVLADDITVNEDLTAENLRVWTPIGTESTPYYGSFYGNGHTVSGLYCKNTNTNGYVGFFGKLGYYPVSDLHIANSCFEGYYAGGIAGYSEGAATEKCSVSDDVTVKGTYIGGIYGYAVSGSAAIENCFSLAKIDGTNYAGGLVGSNYTAIKNCYTDFMQPVGASGGEGSFENVYYTKDTRNYTNADGSVTQKPTFEGATEVEDFASGEVAYKLQSGVKGEIIDWVDDGNYNCTPVYDEAPQIWGQKIGTDKYPTFSAVKVYEDTYNSEKAYRNEIDGNKILLLGADKKSATVVLDKAGAYTIVFADYEAMQLANLKTFEVTVDKAQAVRVISDKDFTLGTGDKIMLWDNLKNLTPMCEAHEVK